MEAINLEKSKNKVLNMDCLEFMKQVPDNYFDLVLTDPPYGIGASNDFYSGTKKTGFGGKETFVKAKEYKKSDWDNKTPNSEVFYEILRISKNSIIFGGNYFMENLHSTPCVIVWDKDNGGSSFADCELAWTNFESAVRKYKFRWHGMLQQQMQDKEERHHPTQKPIELFKMILRDYAVKKDKKTVFDPFMGSGTTAIACKSLGLDFWGTELDEDYCKIIEKRLSAVQGSLF